MRERVFGLDIVRALAVTLVVFGHMLQHSQPYPFIGFIGRLGVEGVELFFVLSGFLIGGIVVDALRAGKFERPEDLAHFWSRRWLRTLPLYYLFLFIYLRFDWTGATRLSEHPEYLVFLQNFAWRCPDFFLLSWSLCIEEYFYLLFPVVFYLLHRFIFRDRLRSLKLTLGFFLLVPFFVKFLHTPFGDWQGFDFNLRMVVIKRLDSLMYGVAAVFVKSYHPVIWARVRRLTPIWAALAFGFWAWIYFDIPGLYWSRWVQILFFPVGSLLIALLLPFFDSLRGETRSAWKAGVTYLSKISYSLYLGHILIITLVNRALNLVPWGMTEIYPHPLRLYPIYFVGIMCLAPITYYGWELPFLRLRDRKAPLKAVPVPGSVCR